MKEWITIKRLAKSMDVDVKAAKELIPELIDNKYIVKRGKMYRILQPE